MKSALDLHRPIRLAPPPSEARGEALDALVVGAGPVGATLACALARGGASVGIVEAFARPGAGTGGTFDARPIALSVGSRRILDGLGAWAAMADAACPIRRIHVSDRGRFAFARMAARDYGLDALGHVVEASALGPALDGALAAAGPVRSYRPARVRTAAIEPDAAVVTLEVAGAEVQPARFRARLLVIADGGRSSLRRTLGIGAREKSYEQVAVVATVGPALAHRETAYERFTPDGPIALLPMTRGRCGLVWANPIDRARRLAELADAEFLAALHAAFGGRLGAFVSTGPRVAYPLSQVRSRDVVRPRIAVIGSAANHLHPVAGQALNLGLRDAAALAEVALDAIRAGEDPGDAAVLERYHGLRRLDHRSVAGLTDSAIGVFSSDALPVALARGAGLLALDLAAPLKRAFVMRATGLAGRQSRLARGLAP